MSSIVHVRDYLFNQVSTDGRASEYLAFLQSILSPFLESYWHTALALLQMERDTEGLFITAVLSAQHYTGVKDSITFVILIFSILAAELTFLRQLHANLVKKAEKGLLSNGNQQF